DLVTCTDSEKAFPKTPLKPPNGIAVPLQKETNMRRKTSVNSTMVEKESRRILVKRPNGFGARRIRDMIGVSTFSEMHICTARESIKMRQKRGNGMRKPPNKETSRPSAVSRCFTPAARE